MDSNYGNASSVFTQSGGLANYVMERVSAGMVGVNIGVPVPREPFLIRRLERISFWCWRYHRKVVPFISGRQNEENVRHQMESRSTGQTGQVNNSITRYF